MQCKTPEQVGDLGDGVDPAEFRVEAAVIGFPAECGNRVVEQRLPRAVVQERAQCVGAHDLGEYQCRERPPE